MTPERPRGLVWRVVASVAALLLIAGACSVWFWNTVASQNYTPQIVGQNCGQVAAGRMLLIGEQVQDLDDGEACLWQAYTTCKTATLVYVIQGVDTEAKHTITVRPKSGACAVADILQSYAASLGARSSHSDFDCARMARQTEGLLIEECGEHGNLLVPARPAQQVGHVCGEMFQPLRNTSPSGIGPFSAVRGVTVASMEACFWQAYTTCARPSTLVYWRLGVTSGPINSGDTFVVQRVNGVCSLTDASTNLRDAHGSLILTPAGCVSLTRARDGGLVARGCGPLGDIMIPIEQPTPTYAP